MMEFTAQNWPQHECVEHRPANEADVNAGRAVYYVPGSTEKDVHPTSCPAPAFLMLEGKPPLSVIVLQAHSKDDDVIFGLIDQHNNQFVATSSEVIVLDSASEDWIAGLEESE